MNFKEYLGLDSLDKDNKGRTWTHREKYSALVNALGYKEVKKCLPFTVDEIKTALKSDEHLNNLSIGKWDAAGGFRCTGTTCTQITSSLSYIIRKIGVNSYSCSDTVCILKECARMAAEEVVPAKVASTKIEQEILAILAECKIENNTIYLPPEQLGRSIYEKVNKCLVNIGGKWNRKAKGHVFDYDPTEAFDNLVLTGKVEDMKKTFQFFPTPRPIAEMMCDMAELIDGQDIFEPSCGRGDLADVIYKIAPEHLICNELNKNMKKHLDEKPYTTMYADFLEFKPETVKPFDRIVMNPPFSKQQDIDHIVHAYSLLKDGGILVSVVSVSPFFRTNKKSVEFRGWLDELGADIIDVEAGAFKESGTTIPTKIIKIVK